MKKIIATLCLSAVSALAAVQGDYIEARTADVFTGPCFANSEVELVGNLAVFAWKVKKGNFDGVTLDGLSVIGVVRASGTLGNIHGATYPVKSVILVDERANPEQRLALQSFAKRMGGDLLQDVVGVHAQPISFEIEGNNIHAAKARLSAGTLATIQTRGINNGDHLCSNEETWYSPLTKVDHAMPAYALAHTFTGKDLGTTWSSPEKRSAFVASFHLND